MLRFNVAWLLIVGSTRLLLFLFWIIIIFAWWRSKDFWIGPEFSAQCQCSAGWCQGSHCCHSGVLEFVAQLPSPVPMNVIFILNDVLPQLFFVSNCNICHSSAPFGRIHSMISISALFLYLIHPGWGHHAAGAERKEGRLHLGINAHHARVNHYWKVMCP